MALNWHNKPSVSLFTGKMYSGKTTLFMRELLRGKESYKFVFDYNHEISDRLRLPMCVNWEQMKAAVIAKQPVLFYSSEMFPGNRREAFDIFTRWVLRVSEVLPGKKVFACDELTKFVDVGRDGLPDTLREMVEDSRKRGIKVLFVCHALNELNDRIRKELTDIYCFSHDSDICLNKLKQWGFDIEAVKKLKTPGGYIHKQF